MSPANRVLTGVTVFLLIVAFLVLTGCSGRIGVMAWEGQVDAADLANAAETGTIPTPLEDGADSSTGVSAQGCMVHLHDVDPRTVSFLFESSPQGKPTCKVKSDGRNNFPTTDAFD